MTVPREHRKRHDQKQRSNNSIHLPFSTTDTDRNHRITIKMTQKQIQESRITAEPTQKQGIPEEGRIGKQLIQQKEVQESTKCTFPFQQDTNRQHKNVCFMRKGVEFTQGDWDTAYWWVVRWQCTVSSQMIGIGILYHTQWSVFVRVLVYVYAEFVICQLLKFYHKKESFERDGEAAGLDGSQVGGSGGGLDFDGKKKKAMFGFIILSV